MGKPSVGGVWSENRIYCWLPKEYRRVRGFLLTLFRFTMKTCIDFMSEYMSFMTASVKDYVKKK